MSGKRPSDTRAQVLRPSTPESLDSMMQVTSPTGWMLLILCISVLIGSVIWSVVHRIPERVHGQGILIPGRTQAVEAPVNGIVTRVFVEPGQSVSKGDSILALTVPNAMEELEILRQDLAGLERDNVSEEEASTTASLAAKAAYEENVRSYRGQLNRARAAENSAQTRLDRQRKGGFSVAEQQAVISEIKNIQTQISTLVQNLESLEKSRLDELYGVSGERRSREERLRAKREEIFQKEIQVERVIGAENEGRVFNVMVDEGDTVSADQVLVRLEQQGQELQALIYVPSRPGQKVRLEDPAEVSPSNIGKTNFGSIKARVTVKADYPSTRAGLVNDLRNETLADEFLASGAPLRMEITLQADPADPSGYQWTEGPGPPLRLNSGTPCEVTLIVDQKRPIDYVVPLFKRN